MKIALTRDVTPPSRGTSHSAGLDFFVPKFNEDFVKSFNQFNDSPNYMGFFDEQNKRLCVHSHGRVYIPSGVKVEIPDGYALIAFNKGGVSWKQHLSFIASVVDQDYMGEIFITLFNYLDFKTTIQEGQKLIQLVLIPVLYDGVEIVPEAELYKSITGRGEGAMGSTGG